MSIGPEPKPTKARKAFQKAIGTARKWCDKHYPGDSHEAIHAQNRCRQAQDVLLWELGRHGIKAVYRPVKKKKSRGKAR